MRYTLFYTNHKGKKDWMDNWMPVKESVNFKTLKEAKEYLALMKEEENAYIYDNVSKKVVNN